MLLEAGSFCVEAFQRSYNYNTFDRSTSGNAHLCQLSLKLERLRLVSSSFRNYFQSKVCLPLRSFRAQTMAEPQIVDNVLGSQRPPSSPFRRFFDCLKAPRRHQLRYMNHACESLLGSVAWKTLIIFFTILLLFGSPIQFLFVPKGGDLAFNILYLMALGVFTFDMVLNLIVDPEYFGFDYCKPNRGLIPQQPTFWTCGIGSFYFWCDVVSTLALCFDISYINGREYAMMEINLQLNEYGVPVGSMIENKCPLTLFKHDANEDSFFAHHRHKSHGVRSTIVSRLNPIFTC